MMNGQMTQLPAVLGGEPAFPEPVHVGRPNLPDRDAAHRLLDELLDNRWLTNDGPKVRELEEKVAELHGAGHCIAVCNGTIGIELVLQAFRISGPVITPSFTFAGTAHAIANTGNDPVFADIDKTTLTVSPAAVEALLTEETAAIMPVNIFGQDCPDAHLVGAAGVHNIPVIYDAAHSFGQPRPATAGYLLEAEVQSFHATKLFNTLEGGSILTDNDALADELRLRRNFGFSGYDNVTAKGTNAKINEFSAGWGLILLKKLPELISRNRENYECYSEMLKAIPGISVLDYTSRRRPNFQYVVCFVSEESFGLNRDELYEALWRDNIRARRYFYPGCHRFPPYQKCKRGDLTTTETISETVLCLPTGEAVDETDIRKICGLIGTIHDQANTVRKSLDKRSDPR